MNRNEIVSHHEMCGREGMSLQRGMNFRRPPLHSIVLSSHRPGAPYDDRLEENGTVVIYEGHDEPRSRCCKDPKAIDQPLQTRLGRPTQNGHFHAAAQAYIRGETSPLLVRVYEKIKNGIWSYNGVFTLEESWTQSDGMRRVFKFKLRLRDFDEDIPTQFAQQESDDTHSRIIPSLVKIKVWKRDKGMCVRCGATTNLHFDHILPFAKGGTSETDLNIQLLCMKHNLEKRDRIQ